MAGGGEGGPGKKRKALGSFGPLPKAHCQHGRVSCKECTPEAFCWFDIDSAPPLLMLFVVEVLLDLRLFSEERQLGNDIMANVQQSKDSFLIAYSPN